MATPAHNHVRIPTALLALLAVLSTGLAGWRVSALIARRPQALMSAGASAGSVSAAHVFADITATAGLDFNHENGARGAFWIPEEMGAGACLFDADGDEDIDAYLLQGGTLDGMPPTGGRSLLFLNDGAGHFEQASATRGADLTGYALGCAAGDLDNDGDSDLYVTRLGADALLLNDGRGHFVEASTAAGLSGGGFGTSVALFDYDRDGWLDIYVARYIDWAPYHERPCFDPAGGRDYCGPLDFNLPAVDTLWHNRGDGTFEDATVSAGIAATVGYSLGVLTADVDDDGWLDVYVATDQMPAALWMNQGDGTFRDEAALRGCAFNNDGMAIAGMGVAAEDLDDDGDIDLIVTNIEKQAHLCLKNNAGVFEDVSHAWGFGGWSVPYTAFGIALFDQDHDGQLDGLVANGAVNRRQTPYFPRHDYAEPNQFIRQNRDGRFEDHSAELAAVLEQPGTSRAAVSGDIDNDGDIDVLITNNGGPVQVLRNDSAPGTWIMLDVREATGHHAVGARVTIATATGSFHRHVTAHTGYVGCNDPRIHVGLGSAEHIEHVEVRWVDRTIQRWSDVHPRQHCRLIRGRSEVQPLLLEAAP